MTRTLLHSLVLLSCAAVSTLTTSCSSQREAPDSRARADTSRQSSWCGVLSPDAYHVLRGKGTEPRFSGEFWLHDADGVYVCMGCGHALFDSGAKFKSNSGWPSFYAPAREASVATHLDLSHGMRRMEIVCGACNGHLGHVFEDGPPPTGLRYCINSVALDFVPRDSVALRVPSVALPNPGERP
jgi:peptide-methionine (R)-S-oxide reductase